jgi:hypothetical protein
MARFITGNTFNTGDQVTAANLNNAVNNAKISTDSVDGTSIDIDTSGGIAKLRVKDSTGAADGVTLAKIAQQSANTVLVRDANSQGVLSAKAVADTEILIGDGDGFTSASLSGDVTMTNAGAVTIADDAVTGAKISDSAALPNGVTATTQSASDNSTKVATTEYVDRQVDDVGTPNNRLRIKMFPTDFKRDSYVKTGGAYIDTDTTRDTVYQASYDIPSGYKITQVTATGKDIDFRIYENTLNTATTTDKGNGTSIDGVEQTITLASAITATDSNYVTIRISDGGDQATFYGGYLTLAKV